MGTILLMLLAWLALFSQNTALDLRLLPPQTEPKQAIEEVASQKTASIVKIRGYRIPSNNNGDDGFMLRFSEGSGFIISEEGKILTNKHVVGTNTNTYRVITTNGFVYDVKNIIRDPDRDIALIIIDPKQHRFNHLPALDLGDSEEIESGKQVAALGNDPGKIKPTLLTGTVLGTEDSIVTGNTRGQRVEILRDLIETDLDLVPGNSGSPLLDESGKVIGINTATSRRGDIGYAIPINDVKKFLETTNS